MGDRLNLDHAATTPMVPAAAQALADSFARWANPSSPHAEGRASRAAIERARGRITAAYGWAGECIFTSGASEAIAIACTRANADAVLVSATEHEAVLRAVPDSERLPVLADGTLDRAALEAALARTPDRALVAVQWGNNETGVLQPLAEIARIVHAAGGLLLADAAQMPVGWDDHDLPQDHADFIAISGHKRGGPIGIGALLVRDLTTLHPSGGQERGYRGGTENMPGAVAFQAALDTPEDLIYMADLRDHLDVLIAEAGGDPIASTAERRTPLIGAYRMPGVAAATQLIRFDLAGIAVSAGAACSSGSMRPSHVLAQMGIAAADAGEVIRVSFGRETGADDIARFVAAWREIAGELRAQPSAPDQRL
ncbi:cysteine desulfurase family protein [Sphingomonas qomolangmaensis]|uniref:Cysteine desulfurase n=1 Tax=Sphingomonas qomolangmaensis TaxID=2918765 RepID=A0ABY5LBZ4_9SPHN|nr:aminotransferase class V-fold PLP-dependent enzyme [Sphingomonas qomolangmaensis]UUL83249.1 aminotransferase class V-fold PLP-dependent enzyme [Sphingomonas qomolangmaensis]